MYYLNRECFATKSPFHNQCGMKFTMTVNQPSINIERKRTLQLQVHCPFRVQAICMKEKNDIVSTLSFLQLLVHCSCQNSYQTSSCPVGQEKNEFQLHAKLSGNLV